MISKLFNYCLIIILLQSCSGGRIGNFLELSFRNIEDDKLKSNANNFNNKKFPINKKNSEGSNQSKINKTKKDFSKETNEINVQKKYNLKSYENSKKTVFKKNLIQDQNKAIKSNYYPQSYRVIIILKDVDPSGPSQKFSNALKNANILFEIEKIERFQDKNFEKLK